MDDEIKQQEEELVDELEQEVQGLEEEFEEVKEVDGTETVSQKQQKVEQILGEVHEQIDFLREIAKEE